MHKQQAAPATITRASSSSQEGINTDNDDGSSMEPEPQNTPATTPITTSEAQQWPVTVGFQSPMVPLGPWECISDSYLTSPFPSLDQYQEPTQAIIGPELQITPMMHNDL